MRLPPKLLSRLPAALGIIALAAIAGAAALGWLVPLDNVLRDWRFGLATRAASGQVVFVDIDSASLSRVGVWPWPRQLHARMLDRLMQLGASDVVFDVDFSASSNEIDDVAFERALGDAGGFAYLAAFRQHDSGPDGAPVYNLPLPRFLKNADPVAVNVSLDASGVVRTYPLAMSIGGRLVPSAATVFAGKTVAAGTDIGIDFSIDPGSIVRISASDLLAGRIDPQLIQGRQAIIGASAVELRDFFVVPRYGIIPGALLQVLASETLKQGRVLNPLGPLPGLGLAVLFIAIGWTLRRRLGVAWTAAAALSLVVAAEFASAVLQIETAILFDTAGLELILAGFVLSVVIGEMRRRGIEKRRAEERLIYLATHDPLTGTLSRTSFVSSIEASARTGATFAVALFDLRRFAAINNTLGHAQGDNLLRQVATRLGNAAPGAVARLSGDRFALLLSGVAEAQAVGLCQALIDHLSFPYDLGPHQATIAASCGVAMAEVSGTDAETLLAHADMALTEAKRRSGAVCAVFAPSMLAALVERQALDTRLRHAVISDEIEFYYQPQVDLSTGAMVAAETLARWRTADLGAISPARFIPAAEETGLIVEMGRRALVAACRTAALWPEEVGIAVNVSPIQFELSDVGADIAAALSASGLPPRRLEIEITESLFVDNMDAMIEKLAAIRAMGVSIALDDFGTGYSSLAYLGRLPFDKLKIDQSFVRRLPGDHEAQAIVATIVSLAGVLGKTVIAEGIERSEQAVLLRAAGCQMGQGFLYGRPVPASELIIPQAPPLLAATG